MSRPDRRRLSPIGRAALVAVAVVLMAAAVALVAELVAGDAGSREQRRQAQGLVGTGLGPASDVPFTADPARHTGPQGRVGQFVVGCGYSHSGPHDPIVHPDHAGASHRHDFFGATGTGAHSTVTALQEGGTTCDKRADTAAYWQPALYDHGSAVVPVKLDAYYRAAPGIDPAEVVAMPEGLALVAGDAAATGPQPGEATGWTCGSATALSDEPPTCPPAAPLHLVLTFPDCWDGAHLDSEDHRSHAAYSAGGRCPSSHPVPIPQLTSAIAFPITGGGHKLTLASGSLHSAHGDFLNAWDPDGLRREVDACIRRDAVCDLASNRGEEPLFAG